MREYWRKAYYAVADVKVLMLQDTFSLCWVKGVKMNFVGLNSTCFFCGFMSQRKSEILNVAEAKRLSLKTLFGSILLTPAVFIHHDTHAAYIWSALLLSHIYYSNLHTVSTAVRINFTWSQTLSVWLIFFFFNKVSREHMTGSADEKRFLSHLISYLTMLMTLNSTCVKVVIPLGCILCLMSVFVMSLWIDASSWNLAEKEFCPLLNCSTAGSQL